MDDKIFLRRSKILTEKIRKISPEKLFFDFNSRIYRQGIINDLDSIKKLAHKKGNCLDFGCGRGIFTVLLADIFDKVWGIDIKPRSGQKNWESSGVLYKIQDKIWQELGKNNSVKFKYYTPPKIKFNDESFDFIVAYAVLEHISENQLMFVLKELNRVLKKDGILYITRTPRKLSYSEAFVRASSLFTGIGGHDRLFSEKEIKNNLKKAGFKIKLFKRTDFIPAFLIFQKISESESGFKLIDAFDKMLLASPFKYFAHHMNIVCMK